MYHWHIQQHGPEKWTKQLGLVHNENFLVVL